jgi:hypothetical protein
MSYEPMVINAKVVAEHLEHHHLPRMAQWALSQDNAVAREQLVAKVLQQQLRNALARLEKYEPKETHTPVSCVPPPESSD